MQKISIRYCSVLFILTKKHTWTVCNSLSLHVFLTLCHLLSRLNNIDLNLIVMAVCKEHQSVIICNYCQHAASRLSLPSESSSLKLVAPGCFKNNCTGFAVLVQIKQASYSSLSASLCIKDHQYTWSHTLWLFISNRSDEGNAWGLTSVVLWGFTGQTVKNN